MKQYSDTRDAVFGELYSLALGDPKVTLLSADTGALMFKEFKQNIPEQFYNVGVAEQNAMSLAAGLALSGRRVFVFGITSFVTLRCYEQIKIDICSMELPVTILGMGTGYVYSEDGPTHHMIEDVALMRALPKMTIWSPSDYVLTASAVHLAYETPGPSYIRFDKGPFNPIYEPGCSDFKDGLSVVRQGQTVTVVATGIMVNQACKAAEELKKDGIEVRVIDLYRLKPVNSELLTGLLKDARRIITLEEHTVCGGLGSIVSQILVENGIALPVKILGIRDQYCCEAGSRERQRSFDGIDLPSIIHTIKDWVA